MSTCTRKQALLFGTIGSDVLAFPATTWFVVVEIMRLRKLRDAEWPCGMGGEGAPTPSPPPTCY